MNRRSQAEVYLGIALGTFGFSMQTSDWSENVLLVLAILSGLSFLLITISSRLNWRWMDRVATRLVDIPFGHLTLFLGLSGLAVALAVRGDVVLSIIVSLVGYVMLIWGFIPRRAREQQP